MKRLLVKLHFRGPVHFGESGIGMEESRHWMHSDTLFSALINSASLWYDSEKITRWMHEFTQGTPPFRISSAFPFTGDVYFLPKPLSMPPVLREQTALRTQYDKELKKLSFLPLELFKKWQHNQTLSESDMHKLFELRETYHQGFAYFIVPRVALDRMTSASEIYNCGLVRYQENAGLFCLLEVEDPMESELFTMFQILGEQGLGGERTYGYGRFSAEFESMPIYFENLFENFQDATGFTTFSLLLPEFEKNTSLADKFIAYSLEERKGWVFSITSRKQAKRQTVWMLQEGSVYKQPLHGKVVEVTPQVWQKAPHRVYRYGLALNIPLFWE